MRRTLILVPVLASLLCPRALADEVRLADGRVLVGSTKKVGEKLHVKTLDGTVVVAAADVVRVRSEADLRTAFDELAAKTPRSHHGWIELARTARDFGLHEAMWEQLGRCYEDRFRPANVTERLDSFLTELEPVVLPKKWRKQTTDIRVRELLFRIKPGTPRALHECIEVLLAAEPEALESLRARARSSSRPDQRLVALGALERREEAGNQAFVVRSTILDSSREVRAKTAAMLGGRGHSAKAINYLAPGLLHDHPDVRVRTAEAFGHMRDPAAVPLLVTAGPLAGTASSAVAGGGQRGNIAILQQQSYIRDFQVEVAQASFIADPQVDVLQSGVVLDTTVLAVTAHRTRIVNAYRNALRQLAGSDPGYQPKKWAAWAESQQRAPTAAGQTKRR